LFDVDAAYERLGRWDTDSLLELFADDAKFFVPGTTRISGDHDRAAIPGVLDTMREIAGQGFRRDILGVTPSESGALVVLHEYVNDLNYHCIHDWDVRDGKVAYWWIYVHEYEAFERAWA
jgi:ketosteroid isomerase-like protein